MATESYRPPIDATIESAVGVSESRGFIAHYSDSPAAESTTGVHAAVTDNGSEQTITTGITDPDVVRNVTATAGGTAGDIKAIQVVVTGTNIAGEVITETLPAFTVNTAGTVVGSKAFKTITSITIPAHDGTGATTAIGTGSKLGLSHRLPLNTVLAGMTTFNGTREGVEPTVAVSSSAVESNTVDLDSALDGSEANLFYIATPGS